MSSERELEAVTPAAPLLSSVKGWSEEQAELRK
jgi:hypothetical protein